MRLKNYPLYLGEKSRVGRIVHGFARIFTPPVLFIWQYFVLQTTFDAVQHRPSLTI